MNAQNLYPVPYHTFTLRGSKRDLLLPEFRPDLCIDLAGPQGSTDLCIRPESKMHRRQMLKYGAAGVMAYGVLSNESEDAEAGFFGFIVASFFSAAIGWFVERALDYMFSRDFGYRTPSGGSDYMLALAPLPIAKPTPTGIRFHNHYADEKAVGNETVYNDRRNIVQRRTGYDLEFGMELREQRDGAHLQRLEPNAVEATQMKIEVERAPERFYDKPLLPAAPRRALTDADTRILAKINLLYELKIKASDVLYVYEQRDLNRHRHTGVAVRKGSKAQFLLDTDI